MYIISGFRKAGNAFASRRSIRCWRTISNEANVDTNRFRMKGLSVALTVGGVLTIYSLDEESDRVVQCEGNQRRSLATATSMADYAPASDVVEIFSRYSSKIEVGTSNDFKPVNDENNSQAKTRLKFDVDDHPLNVSVRALRGGRFHMEDEYFIGDGGRFVAIFDGHGGGGVSSYLREQLYSAFQKYLNVVLRQGQLPTLSNRMAALKAAFNEVDTKVLLDDDLKDQGSTAVCCMFQKDEDGNNCVLTANVGDSRAVLARRGRAIDLTVDHKPGSAEERERIESLGGDVEYDYHGGFFRVGNLSVSRAIGDRYARPLVCGEADIKEFVLKENHDEFIVLASDGLFDVMSSQTVVNFVRKRLEAPLPEDFPIDDVDLLEELMSARRKKMTKFLAKEAIRRGSMDNISVIIVWLNEDIDSDIERLMVNSHDE